MVDCEHILLVDDRRVLFVPKFPLPAFRHYKQPLSIVAAFDYNAMDAVVVLALVELHVVLVVLAAHTADTSSVHDVAHADSAGLEVDAFPIKKYKKNKQFIHCRELNL